MPPRLCCCDSPECTILQDLFDRADSTNLGFDWIEESGDAEISGGQLVLASGDKVSTVARNPGSTRGYAAFEFTTPSTGVTAGSITLNFGAANSVILTFEMDDSYLTLTAGSQTRTIDDVVLVQKFEAVIWQRDSSDTYICEVAMSNNIAYIRVYGATTPGEGYARGAAVWDHEYSKPSSGGGRLAIECTNGQMSIDNLLYTRHYDDRSDCPRVACPCGPESDRKYVPWKLRVDFFSDDGIGNGCDIFNGGYFEIENVLDGGQEPGANRWECISGEVNSEAYGWGVDWPVSFFVCAPGGTPFEMSLSIIDCTDPVDVLASDTYSCTPFIVEYATAVAADLTEPCYPCVGFVGSFYAVMTDAT